MKKKSFLLYVDSAPQIDLLSDEEAGKLIKGIFHYVEFGEELETDNRVLAMTFAVFKAQIDRGIEKYDSICKKRAEAANKKWERYKSMQMNPIDTNGCNCIQMDASDTSKGNSDSVSDSHSESDIKKESKKKKVIDAATAATHFEERKEEFYNSLVPYVSQYGREMVRAFFNYWSEPNKSHSKMRFELERTWDVARRLGTWASKDNQFNSRNNGTNRQSTSTPQSRAADAASIVARLIAEDNDGQ